MKEHMSYDCITSLCIPRLGKLSHPSQENGDIHTTRELTSSSLQRSSSYLYHLMSPSSFLARWHMVHDSLMHVINFFSLLALSRIDLSSALKTLLGAGSGGASTTRQWAMLSTSSPGRRSRSMIRASLNSTEQRMLRTFRFGRNSASVDAK